MIVKTNLYNETYLGVECWWVLRAERLWASTEKRDKWDIFCDPKKVVSDDVSQRRS